MGEQHPALILAGENIDTFYRDTRHTDDTLFRPHATDERLVAYTASSDGWKEFKFMHFSRSDSQWILTASFGLVDEENVRVPGVEGLEVLAAQYENKAVAFQEHLTRIREARDLSVPEAKDFYRKLMEALPTFP